MAMLWTANGWQDDSGSAPSWAAQPQNQEPYHDPTGPSAGGNPMYNFSAPMAYSEYIRLGGAAPRVPIPATQRPSTSQITSRPAPPRVAPPRRADAPVRVPPSGIMPNTAQPQYGPAPAARPSSPPPSAAGAPPRPRPQPIAPPPGRRPPGRGQDVGSGQTDDQLGNYGGNADTGMTVPIQQGPQMNPWKGRRGTPFAPPVQGTDTQGSAPDAMQGQRSWAGMGAPRRRPPWAGMQGQQPNAQPGGWGRPWRRPPWAGQQAGQTPSAGPQPVTPPTFGSMQNPPLMLPETGTTLAAQMPQGPKPANQAPTEPLQSNNLYWDPSRGPRPGPPPVNPAEAVPYAGPYTPGPPAPSVNEMNPAPAAPPPPAMPPPTSSLPYAGPYTPPPPAPSVNEQTPAVPPRAITPSAPPTNYGPPDTSQWDEATRAAQKAPEAQTQYGYTPQLAAALQNEGMVPDKNWWNAINEGQRQGYYKQFGLGQDTGDDDRRSYVSPENWMPWWGSAGGLPAMGPPEGMPPPGFQEIPPGVDPRDIGPLGPYGPVTPSYRSYSRYGGGQDTGEWSMPGQESPPGRWSYTLGGGWQQPGVGGDLDGTQAVMGAGFNPQTRGAGYSLLSHPPGEQAPVDMFNVTPGTGQVHPPGQMAPVDQQNYSLMAA